MDNFVMGVDLGQSVDYTAISIIECLNEGANVDQMQYHLRYLERPPLGTLYPQIVARVKGLLATPPLSAQTTLVVDQTGVGRAVVDMFRAAGLKPHAITIHGGDTITYDAAVARVPKRELVGRLVALFQSGQFRMAASLPLAPVIKDELLNFKMKINIATGADTFESWREKDHDDCVLSVALAAWKAHRDRRRILTTSNPSDGLTGQSKWTSVGVLADAAADQAAAYWVQHSEARPPVSLTRPSKWRID
jgi:hypothetical protein